MNSKIKGFDGLRGLAILMVILSHGGIWPRIEVTNKAFLSIFSAHKGVDIFFAISGFLITIFLIKEKVETGKIRIGKFLIRRTLRIFPIYYLAIFLLFIIDFMGMAKVKTCTFLYLLTFVQNYAPAECSFSSMSHFWALAVEQHFYMVWPFIFSCLG
jgi:peptidoglycan/LPS O-acetylase OafA/YrhL